MSANLESRILARLIEFVDERLSYPEMAAELVDVVYPPTEDYGTDNPLYDSLIRELGICTNCLCVDCACCVGCGGIDADVFGAHGYWCAL